MWKCEQSAVFCPFDQIYLWDLDGSNQMFFSYVCLFYYCYKPIQNSLLAMANGCGNKSW